MRAAIYARISTHDKGQNIDTQLFPLREYCRNNNLEVFKEYIDIDSGRNTERPALKQLLKDATYRRFDRVVIWKMDRLSRAGIKHVFDVLDFLKKCNVSVISITEPFLSTDAPASELILSILAWAAKLESQLISQRVKAGMERARKQGKLIGRPKIELDFNQVKELRAQGLSYRAIARQLSKKLGEEVSYLTVYRLIQKGPEKVASEGIL
jgi:DNA invertase Pin-like site-specific DNA recombinase